MDVSVHTAPYHVFIYLVVFHVKTGDVVDDGIDLDINLPAVHYSTRTRSVDLVHSSEHSIVLGRHVTYGPRRATHDRVGSHFVIYRRIGSIVNGSWRASLMTEQCKAEKH